MRLQDHRIACDELLILIYNYLLHFFFNAAWGGPSKSPVQVTRERKRRALFVVEAWIVSDLFLNIAFG